jgi:hypothetical protein
MPLRIQLSPSNPVRPLLRTRSNRVFYVGFLTHATTKGLLRLLGTALHTPKVFVYLDLSGDVADNAGLNV